ncbi:RNA-directed DNA polymerase from mobile element jockey [Nosema granulosis]|uniref:RNA-directed DNA polymerase from mobile element jockey n=1 Tax=Nosema granulosis TaxID=83296 RepID=A0A9P6KYJ8_9MICR|nr:RNA-directed DNA polymerase from mobile element jockey [Nosema granulosis]
MELPPTGVMPQGSVLGPALFIIFINDLDSNVLSNISKFADNSRIGGKVQTEVECQQIHIDLNKIDNWSEKWQIKFNVDICNVMHKGPHNLKHKHSTQTLNVWKETHSCQRREKFRSHH